MGAVTYSNENVASVLNEDVIPLQLPFDAQPHATDYNVKWTPALFIVDREGLSHHDRVGFLPPEEFVPFLKLGMGKALFDQDRFAEAMGLLHEVITDYPHSIAAPEAVYLQGVCRYKSTHEPDGLIEAYEKLSAEYPSSDWARRAEPYVLLKEMV